MHILTPRWATASLMLFLVILNDGWYLERSDQGPISPTRPRWATASLTLSFIFTIGRECQDCFIQWEATRGQIYHPGGCNVNCLPLESPERSCMCRRSNGAVCKSDPMSHLIRTIWRNSLLQDNDTLWDLYCGEINSNILYNTYKEYYKVTSKWNNYCWETLFL
jgi:hypothetical protein